MKTLRMTDRWVTNQQASEGRDEFADAIVRGLRLRVSPRSKKWSVITRRSGRQVRIAIGEYPAMGLAAARAVANDQLSLNSDYVEGARFANPGPADGPPLRQLFEDYIGKMERRGQNSAAEYRRVLIASDKSFLSFMRSRLDQEPLAKEVMSKHVADWLHEVYRRAPTQASHCRAYLHAVFNWAARAEFDFTSQGGGKAYGVSTNPVSATPSTPKSKPRSRVLSKEELKFVWEQMPDVGSPSTVTAVRMVIAMGGLRITEILNSKKGWYQDGWLTLPQTKNGREHSLPLTEEGLRQLEIAMRIGNQNSEYLFPHLFDPVRPMLTSSVGRMIKRLVEDHSMNHFQPRDIRRTMKTQLLDGEYVEEREIDVWHNHGQNSDVARKHYSWAEYKGLKLRVATAIDNILIDTLN